MVRASDCQCQICPNPGFKGTVSRDFCFWFFSWTSFPQASDYASRAVSNFFEYSRRYSQLKVCHRCQRHRWQMEKTFKQKNFNNFVWTPLGSRVNIYIHFCLQVHFKVTSAWHCCQYLPPVSLTPVANLPLISTTLAKMVEKFSTGVADTGGKFATGVVDTGGAPWLANISADFRKNSKRSKWNTLGRGGNWFMKKTRSKKSRDTFNPSIPRHSGIWVAADEAVLNKVHSNPGRKWL